MYRDNFIKIGQSTLPSVVNQPKEALNSKKFNVSHSKFSGCFSDGFVIILVSRGQTFLMLACLKKNIKSLTFEFYLIVWKARER